MVPKCQTLVMVLDVHCYFLQERCENLTMQERPEVSFKHKTIFEPVNIKETQ